MHPHTKEERKGKGQEHQNELVRCTPIKGNDEGKSKINMANKEMKEV